MITTSAFYTRNGVRSKPQTQNFLHMCISRFNIIKVFEFYSQCSLFKGFHMILRLNGHYFPKHPYPIDLCKGVYFL
jgi:hypothetical protein